MAVLDSDALVLGDLYQVNTTVNGTQEDARIATLADGGYIVTWVSENVDYSGTSIVTQRYDASGNPVGGETQVNQIGLNDQVTPDVAALSDGGYVVVWNTPEPVNGLYRISVMQYNADGSLVRDEFAGNNDALKQATNPEVTALTDGGYVVTWTSAGQDGAGLGTYFQRFDNSGNKIGFAAQVATTTENNEISMDISSLNNGVLAIAYEDETGSYVELMDVDGNRIATTLIWAGADANGTAIASLGEGGFVATWQVTAGDGQTTLYARRFDDAGQPQSEGLIAISQGVVVGDDNLASSVIATSDGGYFITWSSLTEAGKIYGRHIGPDGLPTGGSAIVITEGEFSATLSPQVAVQNDGTVLVTFEGVSLDGSQTEIYTREVEFEQFVLPTGYKFSDVIQVNSYEENTQSNARVSVLENGNYAIVWSSNYQDGSYTGVYKQLFSSNGEPIGEEQRVNIITNGYQAHATVAAMKDGGYIVSWTSGHGKNYDIYSRLYDATGNPISGEIQTTNGVYGDEFSPSISVLADGSYVVAWQAKTSLSEVNGIWGQRFSKDGVKIGREFKLIGSDSGVKSSVKLVALSDGGMAATWVNSFSRGHKVGYQVFDSEMKNIYTKHDVTGSLRIHRSIGSSIEELINGDVIISWIYDSTLYVRRFDRSGDGLSGTQAISAVHEKIDQGARVKALPDGGYFAVWGESIDVNYFRDPLGILIYGQRVGADGLLIGEPVTIKAESTLLRALNDIDIGVMDNGNLIITWREQDADGSGVYSQIIEFVDEENVTISTSNLSADGNDIILADTGDETLSGGLGDDIYEFGYGDDADVIVNGDSDAANSTDIVKLDAGITANDLWFRQEGNDLVAQVLGTEDQVTLQDWYDVSSENYQAIDQFELADGSSLEAVNVQALVDAMSAFAPTDIASNNVEEHEDYNSLQTTLAASWG